ncbi:MAG: hypothetical protein GY715_19380 [Planctomycetes bacterium]|nr:hypothetical protein [Planctomycetota bacterium]
MRTGGDRPRRLPLAASGAAVLAIAASTAHAQCFASAAVKLLASDLSDDHFGISVSISGDSALIGAVLHDVGGVPSTGAAYVYDFVGGHWVETKLVAFDAAAHDWFGWSSAISGDVAVVGARGDDDNGFGSGSAYVYRKVGGVWGFEAKLIASDGAAHDRFGWSVAVDGDLVVVGADDDDDGGEDSGTAFVFRYLGGGNWIEEAKLVASDTFAGQDFGFVVAVDGDTALIGAPRDAEFGTDAGAAYVYRHDGIGGWPEQAKLTASNAAADEEFGISVSISGDRALVGAWASDDHQIPSTENGSAYVFKRTGTTWTQEIRLLAPDATPGDEFGTSVSIDGPHAVIGVPSDDDTANDSGSAWVFAYDGADWKVMAKLNAPDAANGDEFGFPVSVDGGRVLVGADRNDDVCGLALCNAGSAYIFAGLDDCTANAIPDLCEVAIGVVPDCNANGVPDECDIAAGTTPDLDGDGIPDECQPCDQADLNNNGGVGFDDILVVLTDWGPCPDPPTTCPGDLNDNGTVDFGDILIIISAWGKCV